MNKTELCHAIADLILNTDSEPHSVDYVSDGEVLDLILNLITKEVKTL